MTTEERILESALTVFSRRGYKNSAIKEIAEKAQVNSLTVFRHFHDKKTLFFAAIASAKDTDFNGDVLNVRLTCTDIEADIVTLSLAYLEEVYANIALMRIYIGEAMNFDELKKKAWFVSPVLKAHFQAYMERLEGLTPLAARSKDLLADMFVSYITKKAMRTNKYGNAQSLQQQTEDFRKDMQAQAKCMAFMLTGYQE